MYWKVLCKQQSRVQKLVVRKSSLRVWASHVGSESETHHPGMSAGSFQGNWQTSSVEGSGR